MFNSCSASTESIPRTSSPNSKSYAATATEDLLGPRPRALYVHQFDLTIGQRGAGQQLVSAVGALRLELEVSGQGTRDVARRLRTPGEFTRCAQRPRRPLRGQLGAREQLRQLLRVHGEIHAATAFLARAGSIGSEFMR